MNMLEIKKMSRIERLQAIEALWDSLLDEEAEVESPEWHRGILDERKRKLSNNGGSNILIVFPRATNMLNEEILR